MSNDRQALAELSAWLRAEADRHAVSVAFRDAVVQTHITQLRVWARHVNAISSPAGEPGEEQPQPVQPLTGDQIEDCIDEANRLFNCRRQGPCGQQLTAYDDWKHWLARSIERAHGIGQLGDTGTTKEA